MGYVRIEIAGSFDPRREPKVFQALDHGHADAVARAIEYLAAEVLPTATAQDHRLHAEGATPGKGWDRYRFVGVDPGLGQ